MKYRIHFLDIQDLQKLVMAISSLDCDVNLYDGHKVIDAKSLIAVMNLDLRKKFWIEFMTDSDEEIINAQTAVKEMLV